MLVDLTQEQAVIVEISLSQYQHYVRRLLGANQYGQRRDILESIRAAIQEGRKAEQMATAVLEQEGEKQDGDK